MSKPKGLIAIFARHRVAANLLMLLMVMMGGWSLRKLNTQFLPTVNLNFIVVNVIWPGAAADDAEKSITTPLEKELADLDDVKNMTSRSVQGASTVIVEFKEGTDMGAALDQVNEKVALVPNLPQDSEKPLITRITLYEPIAKIILTGGTNVKELRQRAYLYERQLLDRGISKINIRGLPEEEIAIQIPAAKLAQLRLSLDQIAQTIRQRSTDVPAGNIGKLDVAKQIRSISQQRSAQGFYDLPIIADGKGRLVRLGDIATIKRRPRENSITIEYQGKPAVELELLRSTKASALSSARVLEKWVKEVKPTLPQGLKMIVYDQRWTFIKERINIMLSNGFGGFILIIAILFIMLNRRVAFWVAMGIPISLMTAMTALWLANGSINMVSMFAFIMTLGIIVDDTIVVAEEALTQLTAGKDIIDAVETGAYKMLPPIAASSMTTVAAFFPLLFISGLMGSILLAIPMVVICVILASLIECFFILPGHLHHSLKRAQQKQDKPHRIRRKIDSTFEHFKQHTYRQFVSRAIKNPSLSLSIAVAVFLFSIGLVAGGRINFTFFPQPESNILRANAEFSAGTPPKKITAFMKELDDALQKTNKELSEPGHPIVLHSIVVRNTLARERLEAAVSIGEQFANIFVQLLEPDNRDVSNAQFIKVWRSHFSLPPELEQFTINAPRVGPPGEDLDIEISGLDWQNLKTVANGFVEKLKTYSGTSAIKSNLPIGQEQIIYDVSVEGKALGLTTDNIGRQIRSAFNGEIVQIFHEPNDEVEVRVMLPDEERYRLHTIDSLPIITPGKEAIPLQNAVNTTYQRSLNILRHTDTLPTVHVTATIDPKLGNANQIITDLSAKTVPQMIQRHGVIIKFVGRAEEQADAVADMKIGGWVAIALIYIILAWVFNSYSLPALIMLAIPLGITGAIFGHLFMGIDLTILSLFGIFGLAGIVINDSIILVNRYIQIRGEYDDAHDAIVEASCQRLRAVLLTSLTTIAGLTPLLFETSLQAQFLIPMAVSLSFGLLFGTLLILVVVPCLLVVHQRMRKLMWGA